MIGLMRGFPSQCMAIGDVELVVVGIAQDGGVPQAGCVCERCVVALKDESRRFHPVSCIIRGSDGSIHLIEASRAIASQLGIAAISLNVGSSITPDSVSLTHAHLGHIDGLGQFGKEVMGLENVTLFASNSVIEVLNELLPYIEADGGWLEYVETEEGYVKVRLGGACSTCAMSSMTLKQGIEKKLMMEIPDVKGVVQVL